MRFLNEHFPNHMNSDSRTTSLLFILTSALKLGEAPLSRTTVMKIAYLMEVLRPWYVLLEEQYRFVRYQYGPYSEDVLQRLNFLVLHGLAEVKQWEIRGSALHSSYIATEYGLEIAERVSKSSIELKTTLSLATDIIWNLQSLGIKSATEICHLVYQEPGFDAVLKNMAETGQSKYDKIPLLNPQNPAHPSYKIGAILKARAERRGPVSPREAIRVYFTYLMSNYAIKYEMVNQRG